MDGLSDWKCFSIKALEELKMGEPVVIMTTEWRAGKRLYYFYEASFVAYRPGRGLVSVLMKEGWPREAEFCEANVGYYLLLEPERMHEMTDWNS